MIATLVLSALVCGFGLGMMSTVFGLVIPMRKNHIAQLNLINQSLDAMVKRVKAMAKMPDGSVVSPFKIIHNEE